MLSDSVGFGQLPIPAEISNLCINTEPDFRCVDPCHENATCIETDMRFLCSCNAGFTGDGFTCVVENINNKSAQGQHFFAGPIEISNNNNIGTINIAETMEISFNVKVESGWKCQTPYCYLLAIQDNTFGYFHPLIYFQW
eukprot:181870_1